MVDEAKSSETRPQVLVGEDDGELRSLLSARLRKGGYSVTECHDGPEMLSHLGSILVTPERGIEGEHYDLIISDIRMPGVTGMTVLDGVHLFEGFPPMILITAFGDEETHAEAIRLGAKAVFDKPFDFDDLMDKVQELAPVG